MDPFPFYFDGDNYVARISSSGDRLLLGTYLGGGSDESASGIAVDSKRDVIVVGMTSSSDVPIIGAPPAHGSTQQDIYVAKISGSGDRLLMGRRIGGRGDDVGVACVLGEQDEVIVAGTMRSPDFSGAGALIPTTTVVKVISTWPGSPLSTST